MPLNLISTVVTDVLSHVLLAVRLAQDLVLSFVETSALIIAIVVVHLHVKGIASLAVEINVLTIVLALARLHAKGIVCSVVEINALIIVLENAVHHAVENVLLAVVINVLSLAQFLVLEALLTVAEVGHRDVITDATAIVLANVQRHVPTLVHHGAQADVQEIAQVAA